MRLRAAAVGKAHSAPLSVHGSQNDVPGGRYYCSKVLGLSRTRRRVDRMHMIYEVTSSPAMPDMDILIHICGASWFVIVILAALEVSQTPCLPSAVSAQARQTYIDPAQISR